MTDQVVIENPIINSPYEGPTRHFRFDEEGITTEIVDGRRASSYFVPIPRAKKRGGQLSFNEWTDDRIEENKDINRIRARVAQWREGGYVGVTRTTRRLLDYWTHPERDNKLFFCQIEALETAIYILEVAHKYGDEWIANMIREHNDEANPGLFRMAVKMATGTGKTVVMAMLMAWQVVNKIENRQDARFTDAFLIVTPGITIRDRLRVLRPNAPDNYYRLRDLLPPDMMREMHKAKIVITNFHAFKLKEKVKAGKLTKDILSQGNGSAFTETPDQMLRRVLRDLGKSKRNVIIINDEAHHCYRRKREDTEEKLKGDDLRESKVREEEARIWISGLEAIQAKYGIKAIYDLSATPFFLRGSGYKEGTLFPWVVSDFSLIDAIESGLVKIPRVPVSDDAMVGAEPVYRNLWLHIRNDLPKKGRKTEAISGEPILPQQLEGALQSLYSNYEQSYELWLNDEESQANGTTPPVFIVVCNNTNVSKLVYDHIAGWEKELDEETTTIVPGRLELFDNTDGYSGWLAHPNTVLIDSQQLESGDALKGEFKRAAKREIEEFKAEYRERYPERDASKLTDEDMLREVMNTVGKPGKLGEHIRCVVSVSMLTEGWDANTVTHILGIRAFGTQLLCEQVVGRGLRRVSYVPGEDGFFEPEYAEIYGVPFSFIPVAGSQKRPPRPRVQPTRVHALEQRIDLEITFPHVLGYRYDMEGERLTYEFSEASRLALSARDVPTKTEVATIFQEIEVHTLEDLQQRREQEIAFWLAKYTLETYFRDDDGNLKQWLFPQILQIAREWIASYVILKDNTFPQLLLLSRYGIMAAERIHEAIISSETGQTAIKPILRPYDTLGSTRYVDFNTIKPVYFTDATMCHVSHAVADSSWEAKMTQSLEEMDEVISYVKNDGLGFFIPYIINGRERGYMTDFIVRIDDGHGPDDLLNLIVEVSGEARRDKAIKVHTATNQWVPAVNNHGGFGRWAFIEISDPWDAKNLIRAKLEELSTAYTEV